MPAARDQAAERALPSPPPGRCGTAADRSASRTRSISSSVTVDRAELGHVADLKVLPVRMRPNLSYRPDMRTRRLGTSSRSASSASAATTSAAGSTRPARARSSTRRSTPASRSSTPPTSTATRAAARRCSAGVLHGRRDQRRAGDEVRQADGRRRRAPRLAATTSAQALDASLRAPADRAGRPLPAPRGGPRARRSRRRSARSKELVDEGKIRAFGTSNYAPATLDARASSRSASASRTSRSRASTRGSSARPRHELLPACERLGLGLHPVLPARERPAHRQGDARASAGRGHPAARPEHRRRRARPRRGADARGPRRTALSLLDVAIGGLAAAARRRLGDRRRDEARAGPREREGGRVGALARRARGAARAVASSSFATTCLICVYSSIEYADMSLP